MSTFTIPQAFEIALAHHQSGRLVEAEQIYRQVLAVDARHADALHLLGVIALQAGHPQAAVDLIAQAIAQQPMAAMFHSNLGSALKAVGRFDEATAAFHRALELQPDYPEAHNNLGVAFEAQGKLEEAAACFRAAIRFKPDYAEPHNNLGNVLRNTGHPAEALAEYRLALQANPGFADAHCNLGVALNDLGELDGAVASLGVALQLNPASAEARFNLGNALRDRGNPGAAYEDYRRAIELNPGMARAHNNLGNLLKDWGAVDEALAEYRVALRCGADMYAHSNVLLALHYRAVDAATIFEEHRRWDEVHARPLAASILPHGNDPSPGRRLRIGYVSPDFRGHSVACFLENVLEHHDPAQGEIYCYDAAPRGDVVTERFRRLVSQWRPIHGVSDAEVAALIRRDGIDVLVDLAGHTADHRLGVFARKPAPVQVTWLGYCDTTGMPAMDYRLTDAEADPPGTTEHLHTEKLVRLPTCGWCFRPLEEAPPAAPLPAQTAGCVTFGSFNAVPKITLPQLRLWAEILRAVPGSRLLLKSPVLNEPMAQRRLRDLLAQAGIPAERVELMGNKPSLAEHLATYSRIDLALDTFPYHGVTTTCEALWMGVPVVVLSGATHVSRVGVSLLKNAGLPELLAADPGEYMRIAVALANDLPRLAALRSTLRERLAASPLMDARRSAHDVEAAYREMWQTWCARQTR